MYKESVFSQFQSQQQSQDLLRLITCGSVDDGKSTLIGRLLWESQQLPDDQLETLEQDSQRYGSQNGNLDFALLVDGLSAEREQGITIDVAYRYFSRPERKFILADCPGHEQYTRNMVTAASTADLAVLLIDAQKGLLTQTKRHAYLASLLGVRHILVAVNKMDLVGYDENTFYRIGESIAALATTFEFDSLDTIPISALNGDNIVKTSTRTPWYQGPPLMGFLEKINIRCPLPSERLVVPVQWINRSTPDFRGISATIAEGSLRVGSVLRVTSSGEVACVKEILTMDGSLESAEEGKAITLVLDRDIDVARGDVLSSNLTPLETSSHFEATLVWMHSDPGLIGRNYEIKLATQWASASITKIKHRIDVDTFAPIAGKKLASNDIAVCNISISRSLAFDNYSNSKALGGFILVDRFTNATVAAGMIRHTLRRSLNVHRQALSITRSDREALNGHVGKVVWFTGLSGSGKSTLANGLETELHRQGKRTYILDGDNIRQGLNKDLGFTDADRVENIRRVAEIAKLMMDAGIIVMTAFISPFCREREMAKELIGADNFFEVYVSAPLEVCEQRDVKGLYKKARAGQLPNMTGIDSSYEEPRSPSITIDSSKLDSQSAVTKLLLNLEPFLQNADRH